MDAPILRFDRYNRPEVQTPPEACAVWLEITRGRVRQRIRPVHAAVFLIGTDQDSDLVIGDAAFSGTYAYLLVQNGQVTVRRVGAGPELLVNGQRLDAGDVEAGDLLTFGPFELVLHIQPSPERSAELARAVLIENWRWLAELAEA